MVAPPRLDLAASGRVTDTSCWVHPWGAADSAAIGRRFSSRRDSRAAATWGATGCRTAPEETQGMLGPKWRDNIHDFYTLDGARALRDKLTTWPGGRLVVHINEMPIKCPGAPLEFSFLADTFFRERGIRDKVSITYVTPLSGAFTKPKASKKLSHLLADKNIGLVTEFAADQATQEGIMYAAIH